MASDKDNEQNQAQAAYPSVNDVLAQQMGPDYTEVIAEDKKALQKELQDQVRIDHETEIPSEGVVDDRNTSDGQVIGV